MNFWLTTLPKRKLLALILLIAAGFSLGHAANNPENGIANLTSLTDDTTADPVHIVFTSIRWDRFVGGTITRMDGAEFPFEDKKLKSVIYFSKDYYDSVKADPAQGPYRSGITWKELVIETYNKNLSDPAQLAGEQAVLNKLMDAYPFSKALLAMAKARLDSDQAQLDQGNVLVNGKWMTRAEFAAITPTPEPSPTPAPVTTDHVSPPTPAPPQSIIRSAFGIELGSPYDTSTALQEVQADGGRKMFQLTPPIPFGSLTEYFVLVTPESHRVYSIFARAQFATADAANKGLNYVASYLGDQYGKPLNPVADGSFLLEDQGNKISLKVGGRLSTTVEVRILDKRVAAEMDKEEADIRASQL